MKVLKLTAVVNNIEVLLGGFFDSTYNEHRGPIQIVHQIERVRSSPYFETDDFYQLITREEFQRGGSFNPLDRALEIVDANTKVWRTTTIGRRIELAAAARWNEDIAQYVNLADVIWAAYLHIQSGGDVGYRGLRVLDDSLFARMSEDDGFYHNSEFAMSSLEGKTVQLMAKAAIQRLKDVS